jgi:hypothetical protein
MEKLGEMAAAIGAASGICLLMIVFGSFILNFFVALKERPKRRAAWTVGIPFVVVALFATFSGPPIYQWIWPLSAFIGAVPVYLYYLRQYNFAWVESVDDLPEGVSLAEDDWRSGLVYLFVFMGVAALLVFIRYAVKL